MIFNFVNADTQDLIKQYPYYLLFDATIGRYHKILFIPGEPIFVFRSIHDEVYVSFPQLDNTISIF
jgi:hypothetical protein